ncbi:MAG: hypothetical protein H0U73_06395 [Tatlockia sp.]|nr:hypothetical protein [Tatlockia sp.]
MLASSALLEPHSIFSIWPFYCIICLPLTYFIMLIVPYSMRRKALPVFALFYLLSISIFIFGIIISILLAFIFFYQKPISKKKPFWFTVDYPDYQRPPSTDFLSYGEGSGFQMVRSPSSSNFSREKMLVAVNQFEAKGVSKINTLALSDDMEEVRLYAQSLIEKQERKFSKYIKKFLKELEKSDDVVMTAYYHKQIAEILWEQVYKYLVVDENLEATLEKIKFYAKEAQQVLTDDLELPLILAKINLYQSNYEESRKWLKQAAENEVPDYKIFSILAEIEYNEKNYSAIKNTLTPCLNKEIIGLQPIISFWVTND